VYGLPRGRRLPSLSGSNIRTSLAKWR